MGRPAFHRLLLAIATLAAAAPAAADPDALCAGRPGCEATVTGAGIGGNGEAVSVIELSFATPPAGSWAEGLECRDGWRELYVADGAETRLLLELCNDGYGAAGLGEDEIEIGDNRLAHTQHGGSNWRWSQATTYALSPLLVLDEAWRGYWSVGLNYETGQWDWTDWGNGLVEWWSPVCPAEGEFLDEEEPGPEDITSAVLIPLLESLPPGAEEAALGTCATVLSAETGRGFVVHGDAAAAAADQAWVKLLAVQPDLLMVSVRTGRVASGGKTWLADDHIEIWQGPALGYYDHCIAKDLEARQWAVRLVDGAIFPAAGDPQALPTLLSRSSTLDSGGGVIVSMTLRLAEPLENATVLFSKGDGKKKQLWMLASSSLRFKQPASLGAFHDIPSTAAGCTVNEGRLDVESWGRPVAPAE